MTSKIETEPDAARVALWRDEGGFSRRQETAPGSNVFFIVGPDDLPHAIACDFVGRDGILPCSCDDTRAEYPRPAGSGYRPPSWWFRCWFRWQQARVAPHEARRRVPWPVEGPDEEPWVEGTDFAGDGDLISGPAAPIGSTSVEWGVRDKFGDHAVAGDFEARRIVTNMRSSHDPDAAVVCREVTEWRKADDPRM